MSDPLLEPGNSGGPQPPGEGRSEYVVGNRPPRPDPLPCGTGNYTVSAIVTQKVPQCANAEFFALYQVAVSLVNARLERVKCADGCPRHIVEMFRSWSCGNRGTAANPDFRASVTVTKRLFCQDQPPAPAPNRPWLDPALADNFTPASGVQPDGATPTSLEDGSTILVGKTARLECSETRLYLLNYSQTVASCSGINYRSYVDEAMKRVDALHAAMVCPSPCTLRKTVEWHSWRCEANTVKVDVYFKLECLKPGPIKPGCFGGLLLLPVRGLRLM